MANYRSTRTQRIISVGLAVLGGVMLWTVFIRDIPMIPYTGTIPDGPISIFMGVLLLLTGLKGIFDPESTIPTNTTEGGGSEGGGE
ncbi:hypothetical protein [Halorientalis marina]|uniref:hypothetical protein n=1 Tax=Halorientalis marina TaxID=2931976 RepID=UPI001FF5A48B|nr:hypothetical protein [Halorientalis marina]